MSASHFKLEIYPHEFPTTIYDVAPEPSTTECGMLFFIPGNPGLPAYYVPFLSKIRDSLPGWRIICVSQAGCDTISARNAPRSPDQTYFNLSQQIQHKFEIFTTLLRKYEYFSSSDQKKEVVVAGHSIGCWMLQHMLVQLAKQQVPAPISLVLLLFPTIKNIGQSDSGVVFNRILKYFPHIADVASNLTYYATKFLPDIAVSKAVNFAMQNPPEHAANATRSLFYSPSVVWQSVSLGAEEMKHVKEESEDMAEFFWKGLWSTLRRESSRSGNIVAYFADSVSSCFGSDQIAPNTANEII